MKTRHEDAGRCSRQVPDKSYVCFASIERLINTVKCSSDEANVHHARITKSSMVDLSSLSSLYNYFLQLYSTIKPLVSTIRPSLSPFSTIKPLF